MSCFYIFFSHVKIQIFKRFKQWETIHLILFTYHIVFYTTPLVTRERERERERERDRERERENKK